MQHNSTMLNTDPGALRPINYLTEKWVKVRFPYIHVCIYLPNIPINTSPVRGVVG